MENWTLTWTNLITLNRDSANEIPENLPGVYRLSYKGDDGKYYVFYVGQATDIKSRLLQHLSDSESNMCIRNYLTRECSFRYAKVINENVRNSAERQMYNYYEPSCNERKPDGNDEIQVNLS